MYCRNCGTKLKDAARFCSECGTPVVSRRPRQELDPMPEMGYEREAAPTPVAAPASEPAPAPAAPPNPEPAAAPSDPAVVFEEAPGLAADPTPTPAYPTPPVPGPLPAAGGLRDSYHVIGAAVFGAAALMYVVTCLLMRMAQVNCVLPALACVAAAVLCYLRHPVLEKALPVWVIVEFAYALIADLSLYLHFGVYGPLMYESISWLLMAAFAAVLTLACFDRFKDRRTGAMALVWLAGALGLYRVVMAGMQLRTMMLYGTPTGHSVAWSLAALCAMAAQALVGYVLEQSREPGGVWRTPPSAAPWGTPAGTSGAPASGSTRYPHPYHELGGWLKTIVIVGYVGMAMTALAGLIGIVSLGYLSSRLGSLGGASSAIVGIGSAVILVAVVVVCAFLFVFLGKIRRKDPTFLRDYHLFFIVGTVLGLLGMIASGSLSSLPSLVTAWITMGLYTLYFVKSVRVRTYMGTDAYLRMSPLVSGVPSPVPADTVPYEGPQA